MTLILHFKYCFLDFSSQEKLQFYNEINLMAKYEHVQQLENL